VDSLPSGTVTLLFSDIEGSTRLLQQLEEHWSEVLRAHNRILREAFAAAGGREVDRQGDAFFAVFARARDAVTAAAEAQRALTAHEWPDGARVRVRMGIHTGEPSVNEEGYLGVDVVRGSRICAAARGGQVIVSETTRALVRDERLDGLEVRELGEHRLKDFDEPEPLYELVISGAEHAGVEPPAEPGETLEIPFAGREGDLAAHARDAVRSLDVSALGELGPRIERRVADTLRAAGLGEEAQAVAVRRRTPRREEVARRPRERGAGVVVAAAVVVALIGLAVWLIVKLV
jgi:class 3 adenylate cyclase